MTTSSSSSTASPPLRLELGPSRLLASALFLMGIVAAAGLVLSNMQAWVAAVVAPCLVGWGALLARRELRRAPMLVLLRGDGTAAVDGAAVERFSLDWQGVLARLEWTYAGRRVHRVGWPDVLDASTRRELRLWALGRGVRASTAAVAP